jgi:hypothetical protein
VLRDLPDLRHFVPDVEYDAVISSLGFEKRAPEILTRLAKEGFCSNAKVVLVKYPTNQADNEGNWPLVLAASGRMAGVTPVTYASRTFKNDVSEAIGNALGGSRRRVLWDISTCSSYVFYPTMRALLEKDIDLTIAYCEAESYYPTLEEWEGVNSHAQSETSLYVHAFENAGFQSLGVEDIYPSPLFAEMNAGNTASLLVAIPNFSAMRMNAIVARDQELNKTAEENIIWFIGVPPSGENQWRVDALRKTHNLKNIHADRITTVCTLNYKEIFKALEHTWLENRYQRQMTIANLGSKMQHLGASIFLQLHQEVGLWMAEPHEFRANRFSDGCGSAWQLDVGATRSLKQLLEGYLKFKWKL